jgi:glycosyltransferase involved in cell wall biosynthesis
MDNPLSGGGPVRTFEINRRLALRHEITVLTPTFPRSTPRVVREGVQYERLGRRIGNHGSSHHVTYFFALPKAVMQREYDLLVEDFMPPVGPTFNPLLTRRPVIGSVQWYFARRLSREFKIPFHLGQNIGTRLYPSLVVLTDSMKRKLQAVAPKSTIEAIPNGVDESLFRLSAYPGDVILFLGRIDIRQKGIDLLLRAYAAIPAGERLLLYVVGSGADLPGVENLVRELNLGSDVRLIGRVDIKQRLRLLETCRFVCVPSREETFGMVITEACAAAKPVIYFDLAPMNEVASGAGCIAVPAFDLDQYTKAMRSLIATPNDGLANRGLSCRQRVLGYRWDEVAAHQERFYLGALERFRAKQR